MHRRMRLANGFLVRSAHEAERFAFLQIDMSSMSADAELVRGLFECVELREEFLFREFARREGPGRLVMSVDEEFHFRFPVFCFRESRRTFRRVWQLLPACH